MKYLFTLAALLFSLTSCHTTKHAQKPKQEKTQNIYKHGKLKQQIKTITY